jgi:hypothetical protein
LPSEPYISLAPGFPSRQSSLARPRARFSGALPRRLLKGAFWVWAAVAFVLAATLMVAHSYALPRPETDNPELARALSAARGPADRQRWLAVHFLYGACRCSQRVLGHLTERKALPDVSERLVLVGAQPAYEAAARQAGYAVDVITPEQLSAHYGLTAAPLLVVADPSERVRYVGGYSERKQGLELEDLAIIAELRAGRARAELPLFGCAVSRSLQTLLDPLGLRSTTPRGDD